MSGSEDDVMNVLHEDPQVLVKENFVSKEDCKHFINVCKDKLKDALVIVKKGLFLPEEVVKIVGFSMITMR